MSDQEKEFYAVVKEAIDRLYPDWLTSTQEVRLRNVLTKAVWHHNNDQEVSRER